MNIVLLSGNLATDTSLKATQSGKEMCTFRLAVSSGWGDNKETSFLHIITFGKTAANCDRYLSKGRKVLVRGRIQTGSYEKKDGTKAFTTDIIADEVEFLSGGEDAPKKQAPKREETVEEMVQEDFAALLDDEEVPF